MKKLLISVITALTLLGSAFAVEFKVDADFAIPIETVNLSYSETVPGYTVGGYTMEVKQTASFVPVGLSVGVDAFFTDLLGASFKANFGFTSTMNTKAKYSMNGEEQTMPKQSEKYDSGSSSSFFLGAAIRPLNGKFFFIATPGAILSFSSFKMYNSKMNINAFGLGADLQAGYKITDKIAINGGILAAILFAPKMTMDGEDVTAMMDNVKKSGFIIEPKIGASIFF